MTPDRFKLATLEHGDRLHAYAAWMLGDREEARDVTQECLMRLWIHHSDVAAESARPWLLRTAHRLCVDRLRQARPNARPDFVASPVTATVDGAVARRDDLDWLRSGLERLAPRERSLLLLREAHGLSMAELSAVLGAPEGTVKTWLHRARQQLRDLLETTPCAEVSS